MSSSPLRARLDAAQSEKGRDEFLESFSTENITPVNPKVREQLFESDPYKSTRDLIAQKLDYQQYGEYKAIGKVSDIDAPSLESGYIADAVVMIPAVVLKLRELGFLLTPSIGIYAGNYYLISKYKDIEIDDFLPKIADLVRAYRSEGSKNGLPASGRVPDFLERKERDLLNYLDDIEHKLYNQYDKPPEVQHAA